MAFAHTLSFLERSYAKTLIKGAIRLSDQVVTDSFFSRGEIEAYTGLAKEKIEVIPLAVDQTLFQPSKDPLSDREILKQTYGVDRPYLLFTGSLKSHKNVSALLQAFPLLRSKGYLLLLVGNSDGMRRINTFSQENVRLIGKVPEEDLARFYQCAEMLIFPSLYEGFGLPPLEAMSVGCPTIVSQAGSLPEVCGEAALYIDPHSPQEIVEAIEDLLANPAHRTDVAEKGVLRSREFSWEKCGNAYLELIDRMISL